MIDRGNHSNRLCGGITYDHIMIGILCLGLGIRLLGLNKGIWLDEYFSLRVISAENFLQTMRTYDHPPLFYLFHKIWSQMSMSESILRLVSVIFGIGTVVIMMQWMKRYSRLAGLLAGLLCATLPIMLRYSQEIRGYSVLLFATVCSFFFASRIVEAPKKSRGYVGLACSLTAVVATQLVGIMIVPAVLVFIVLMFWADLRKIQIWKTILAVALPCVVFLYLYLFFLPQLHDKQSWWMPPVSLQLIVSSFKNVLGVASLTAPLQVFQNHIPLLAAPYKYSVAILIIGVSVSALLIGKWRQGGPLLAAAMVCWLQIILYSLLITPIFWYRTLLPGLIPFMGFIAVQIATIRVGKIRGASVLGAVLVTTIFAVGWAGSKAWTPYEQWKQLSSILESRWKSRDLVIFYPDSSEGPVRYYFSDLPTNASIAVEKGANIGELNLKPRHEQGSSIKQETPYRIFFIVRFGRGVQKDIETYNALTDRLESRFGRPLFSQEFGSLSLSQYELKEAADDGM